MIPDPPDGERPAVAVRSSLTIAADALSVRELSGWLRALLESTGDEAAALQPRLELAVHEVCMNVIDHAYGPGHVSRAGDLVIHGEVDPGAIRNEVRDRGVGFDVQAVVKPVPGVPQFRGYGLVIVDKLADDLDYTRAGDVNIFSLRFDRAPDKQGKQS